MKKALLLLVLLAGSASGQKIDEALKPGDVYLAPEKRLKSNDVDLAPEFRLRNSYSNCVWCAAEESFWGGAGWDAFQGIKERAVKEGWRGAGMSNVLKAAKDAGIECESTSTGDYQVLYDAVENGVPCYIEIPGHAIVVVGIDQDGVRVLDNNGDLQVQSWTAAKFKREWEGHACFPLLNRRRHPKPPELPPAPTTPPVVVPDPVAPPSAPPVEVKPIPGPAGPAGKDGTPGKDGAPGPAGPAGKDAQIDYEKLAVLVAEKLTQQPTKPVDSSTIRMILKQKK